MEDKPEHQHQLDRRIRVPSLAAGRGPPWRLPSSQGGLVQPEGQVTAPLQASLVDRPVLDAIAGLRDAVTARGIVLERHARDRNGSAAAGPPAPAPGGSLHQRLCQRQPAIAVRRYRVAVLAKRWMTAAIAHDLTGLLALDIAVDPSHPRVDLVHQ